MILSEALARIAYLEQKYSDAETRVSVPKTDSSPGFCPFCGEGTIVIEANGQVHCIYCGARGFDRILDQREYCISKWEVRSI